MLSYTESSKSAILLEISLIKADIKRIVDSGQANVAYLARLKNNLQIAYTELDKLEGK